VVKFTETETEQGGWDIIAVPENEADMRFLAEDSPSSALGYVKLVLRHAIEAAGDVDAPKLTAAIEDALQAAHEVKVPTTAGQK
jgi:hypothetical protein